MWEMEEQFDGWSWKNCDVPVSVATSYFYDRLQLLLIQNEITNQKGHQFSAVLTCFRLNGARPSLQSRDTIYKKLY